MALLEELLVGLGIDTEDLTTGAQGAADEVESSLGGIKGAAAGAAVGGLFAAGLSNAMDATAANNKLARQLGLSSEEASRAGDIAGDVFSAGFSDSIEGVNEALGAVTQNIGGMGKATDAELAQMTKSAIALADTFEFDVAESTAAVGTLIKTGLAKDGTEALDLLTATAQKLPPAFREELPSLTKEYGEFFDQMGFTGPEMMGLLTQAAKNPTFEIDKMGDALKEFTLLMADTSAVEEPLKTLGLNVKEIQKLMNTGHGTEAFDQVTAALRGVEDQTERTKLQAALFGGPGEDMGNSLLNLKATGADAAAGLDNVAGSAKEVTDSMAASQSLDAIWRTMATTLGELFLPALKWLNEFMTENPGLVKVLAPILVGLAVAIGIAAAAQWVWNAALFAWPGTWIIAGIMAVIAVIALIIVYWDEIAAATGEAWDWITGKLGDAWDWITGKATETWDWVTRKTSDAWDWITGKVEDGVIEILTAVNFMARMPGQIAGWLGDIVDYVAGLPGRIARAASGMWDSLKTNFINVINFLIWKWNNFSLTIGGGSILGIDIPSVTLATPDIPYLADGGVATGPTLAMIGEGRESEAVLPLSKLDGMLRSVAGPVRNTGGQPREQRLVLEVVGAENEFTEFFRNVVRTKGGGDVIQFAEG
ncbi:phage tail tape measure protein [Streptomyces sp. NPDC059278]|uniref:phage tail tape measure protein n=1 Tax=Streptomyces sp. NPDC059278 TaxID=3346801 RepID=UPI00368E28CC